RGIDFNDIDIFAIESACQLQCGESETAEAKNRNRVAGFEAPFVQSMKRSGRRAHHDRADFEWNLVGKRKRIRAGNFDEFCVTAVPMFANHLSAATELFQAAHTKLAASAADQVMHTNAVSRRQVRDLRANFFHAAGDSVPEC